MAILPILTADEFTDLDLEGRWRARRVARETQVSRQILRMFLDRGGPIPVQEIVAASKDSPEAIHQTLSVLDNDDVIRIHEGQIDTRTRSRLPRRRLSSGCQTGRSGTPAARWTHSASRRWSGNRSRSAHVATTATYPWSSRPKRKAPDRTPRASCCGSASAPKTAAASRTHTERPSTSSGRKNI